MLLVTEAKSVERSTQRGGKRLRWEAQTCLCASVARGAIAGEARECEFAERAGLPLCSAVSQRLWAPHISSAA